AEDGIRDRNVTGVQTCALPIVGRKKVDLMIYYLQYDVDTVFIEVDLLIFCLREIQLHHRLSVDGDQCIGTCAGLSYPEENPHQNQCSNSNSQKDLFIPFSHPKYSPIRKKVILLYKKAETSVKMSLPLFGYVERLCVCYPQPMQLAVSISISYFVSLGHHEYSFRFLAWFELFALVTFCGFQSNPLDKVFLCHWMCNFTDGNGHFVALCRDDWNVF